MRKLIIQSNGKKRDEIDFAQQQKELTIGRDPACEISLADPAVSRRHAKLVRIFDHYIIEDQQSTNGTRLNGKQITKHVLKHGDVIRLGQYELCFQDPPADTLDDDLDKTVVMQPISIGSAALSVSPPGFNKPLKKQAIPRIHFLQGPDAGLTKQVNKSVFTIGRPGGDIAVVSRRPQGFFLVRLGGNKASTVNGKPIRSVGVKLNNGDRIAVGDHEAEFLAS